eukprot:2750940-Pleurochrysis_carterae.AAC.2
MDQPRHQRIAKLAKEEEEKKKGQVRRDSALARARRPRPMHTRRSAHGANGVRASKRTVCPRDARACPSCTCTRSPAAFPSLPSAVLSRSQSFPHNALFLFVSEIGIGVISASPVYAYSGLLPHAFTQPSARASSRPRPSALTPPQENMQKSNEEALKQKARLEKQKALNKEAFDALVPTLKAVANSKPIAFQVESIAFAKSVPARVRRRAKHEVAVG